MGISFFTRLKRQPTLPARIFWFFLFLAALGTLDGCSTSDPLAVASGAVFPLNTSHWQPTAGDLAGPPVVSGR